MKLNIPALLLSITVSAIFVIGVSILITKVATRNNETSTPVNEKPIARSKPTTSYKDITVQELKSYLDSDKEVYLLDVHIPEQEHILGTDDFIPFNELENYIGSLPEDKNTEIVVYCRSGSMSKTASETLIDLGYKNVKNLLGGVNAWKANGYE